MGNLPTRPQGEASSAMFQGEFSNNMDEKGRVSIPAPFRDTLRTHHTDGQLFITRSHNTDCLIAYPTREWKRLQAAVKEMPAKLRPHFKRAVITPSQLFSPDKQGRILLACALRQHASLSRSVHFAGTGETFEIWDKASWDKQLVTDLAALQDFELDM
ncbi:MAG: division/cell wall cluster transcriptional repressor MraZ [Mariprofundus sp.]|nr:division/cell wall cluster transcriptional repressor MraZ [Mariprofundus sp.]